MAKTEFFRSHPVPHNNVEENVDTLNFTLLQGSGSGKKNIVSDSSSLKNSHEFLHLIVSISKRKLKKN